MLDHPQFRALGNSRDPARTLLRRTGVTAASRIAAAALGVCVLGGCDQEGDVIGPDGGIVTSADGRLTLAIPPGALDEDVMIAIEEVDDGPDGAIGAVYEISPKLTMLAVPAELVYDYAAPGDAESLTLDAEAFAAAELLTEAADGWNRLADREVDIEEATISASIMYFSTYAVVLD